jgi:hypothetical protein
MARAGRVNSTAASASWWSEVAGSVVLRGPHGTFADVSTLDQRLAMITACGKYIADCRFGKALQNAGRDLAPGMPGRAKDYSFTGCHSVPLK